MKKNKVRDVKAQNNKAIIEFIKKVSQKYDPDPDHGKQVAQLALTIFDELRGVHGYGTGERQLLEIASRLHDIGWSRVVAGKHHKQSRDMIMRLDIPGLNDQRRLLCALIARYHTKALPDAAKHRRFAGLDVAQRKLVEWLAGILRVADGLDCRHNDLIKQLQCKVGGKIVRIHLQSSGNCQREIERACAKQELLLKKLERTIEYRC
ncbi:MAG TPA: HD domain-containing protein [Smithellaceae bacterium]|nr:HD domain-containing protein [Smithellaceae bacterium]